MFQTILVDPIFNLLIFLYNNVTAHDLGFATILLTIIIRFILYPLFYKGMKGQAMIQKIQPEIKEVQKKYKDDREKQALELMAVYKKHEVNPFSSFFYLLIQMPIIIAVYHVFRDDIAMQIERGLYSFVAVPETINNSFLGLIDLTQTSMIIVAIAVVAQYIQGRLAMAANKNRKAEGIARYVVFLGPVMTLIILPQFSAALGLYWLTTSIFSIGQQYIINKKINAQPA